MQFGDRCDTNPGGNQIKTKKLMRKEAKYITDKYPNISFYALRISENKYTGKGGTDTGNRLFNTMDNS